MKILVFGSLNIDYFFSVDHIVTPGETISSDSLQKGAGGKGANQAAALAKAGMSVFMAGKIGRDGRFLLELLESYGVDTRAVAIYEGPTGQAIIQLDRKRQNAILLHAGGNGAIALEEIPRTLANFGPGDTIVLQNEIVYLREIMEGAHQQGMRIILNPSPFNEKIMSLPLELVDILFVNELEGAAMAKLGKDAPFPAILEKLAADFPRAEIVLTAGKEGAYYGFGETRAKGEIVPVTAVDTTGAGDTFSGYFIAARARGLSVDESLAAASKAASITVSRKGAMEAIPLAGEVFA